LARAATSATRTGTAMCWLGGAAAVAKLHASEQFREAMDAARAETERMRHEGKQPKIDCAAEAEALSTGL